MRRKNTEQKLKRKLYRIVNEAGIKLSFRDYTINDVLIGIGVELEHGRKNPKTNVTDDDITMTTKIALAHLEEHSDYYKKLLSLNL